MPTGYQIVNQDRPYFLTLQVVNWVDIFSRKVYRDIIVDSLNYCVKKKGLWIYGYVIMTNHIHVIFHSSVGRLSDTLRDFKSYTAKQILETIDEHESRRKWMLNIFSSKAVLNKRNSEYQFWTQENHAMEIFSSKFFESKLDYIHLNPVRAGYVARPEDYLYSSAVNYNDEIGLVQVEIIPRIWKTV